MHYCHCTINFFVLASICETLDWHQPTFHLSKIYIKFLLEELLPSPVGNGRSLDENFSLGPHKLHFFNYFSWSPVTPVHKLIGSFKIRSNFYTLAQLSYLCKSCILYSKYLDDQNHWLKLSISSHRVFYQEILVLCFNNVFLPCVFYCVPWHYNISKQLF